MTSAWRKVERQMRHSTQYTDVSASARTDSLGRHLRPGVSKSTISKLIAEIAEHHYKQ